MVYSSPFLRVVMSGPTYGVERFSCGVNIGQNFDGPIVQPATIDPYVAACSAWFARIGSRISAVAKLDEVKVNLIGVNGLYVGNTGSGTRVLTTPISGGGGSGNPPPQNTVALTLLTARARGVGSRGRIYPPLPSVTLTSAGQVDQGQCAGMADSLTTLLNDLNAIGDPGRVSVISEVANGMLAPVVRVECGRVVDTQRRRRRQLSELRVPAATALAVPVP